MGAVMLQGTGSDVGKSVLVAGLRSRRGASFRVLDAVAAQLILQTWFESAQHVIPTQPSA